MEMTLSLEISHVRLGANGCSSTLLRGTEVVALRYRDRQVQVASVSFHNDVSLITMRTDYLIRAYFSLNITLFSLGHTNFSGLMISILGLSLRLSIFTLSAILF